MRYKRATIKYLIMMRDDLCNEHDMCCFDVI